MKTTNLFIFVFLSIFILALNSCQEDDEDPISIVNFEQEAVNRTTDDLSPIEVDFSIDPPAPKESEFGVSISGAEAGKVFETTPAISNDVVTVPVSAGDTEAQITIRPLEDGIGFDDVVLEMGFSSLGEGLTSGTTTESKITIAEPMIFFEDFDVCNSDDEDVLPPEGWTEQVVQQNAEGSAVWQCIGDFIGEDGIQINAFVNGSDDETSSEVWMISPRIDLSDASSPILSFDVDRKFGGTGNYPEDLYDIMISTDYNGNNFDNATWERFDAGFDAMTANDPGEDDMENTGDLDLSDYIGEEISIGFVYRAGPPGGFDSTILRIGNVSVSD